MLDRPPRRHPRMSIALAAVLSALLGGIVLGLPGGAATTAPRPQTTAMRSLRTAPGGRADRRAAGQRIGLRNRQKAKHAHRRRHGHKRARRQAVRIGPAGPPGPTGPPGAPGPQIAISLTINWLGSVNAAGHDTATGQLSGVGTLTVTCNTDTQTLSLAPAGNGGRSVLDVTTFQGEGTAGASSNQRLYSESNAPVSVELPNNGMMSGTVSAEPIGGDGGQLASPASFLLSTEWKNNDPDPGRNYCYVAAQVLQQR